MTRKEEISIIVNSILKNIHCESEIALSNNRKEVEIIHRVNSILNKASQLQNYVLELEKIKDEEYKQEEEKIKTEASKMIQTKIEESFLKIDKSK